MSKLAHSNQETMDLISAKNAVDAGMGGTMRPNLCDGYDVYDHLGRFVGSIRRVSTGPCGDGYLTIGTGEKKFRTYDAAQAALMAAQ